MTLLISSLVLVCEKEKRIVFRSGEWPMALRTWDSCSAPEVQALPPEALTPAMSSCSNNISDFGPGGKEMLSTWSREFS